MLKLYSKVFFTILTATCILNLNASHLTATQEQFMNNIDLAGINRRVLASYEGGCCSSFVYYLCGCPTDPVTKTRHDLENGKKLNKAIAYKAVAMINTGHGGNEELKDQIRQHFYPTATERFFWGVGKIFTTDNAQRAGSLYSRTNLPGAGDIGMVAKLLKND